MPDQVVICRGGIIGVATAYYLTLQGIKPILVEKKGIACAASGVAVSPYLYFVVKGQLLQGHFEFTVSCTPASNGVHSSHQQNFMQ